MPVGLAQFMGTAAPFQDVPPFVTFTETGTVE
jgi:hypothetical protein